MQSKQHIRVAAFFIWAALLLLLAAAVLRTTDLSANLAKLFTPAPTATTARPTPTPVPLREFPTPATIGKPTFIIATPDGALWLTYSGGIARVDVAGTNRNNPVFTLYPVAAGVVYTCAGPDGAVWFTESKAAKIGRITSTGSIQEFALPAAQSGAGGITTGLDGALWYTLPHAIGRLSTSGDTSTFPLPSSYNPSWITAGPDGAIWFTDYRSQRVGRMTLSGVATAFTGVSDTSSLSEIVAGPDGALWFPEGPNAEIGRITTAGQVTEFATPQASVNGFDWLTSITVGPDKALWFAASTSHHIDRMTITGKVTNEIRFSPGTKLADFFEITATSDAVWFTDPETNAIGRIDVLVVTAIGSGR